MTTLDDGDPRGGDAGRRHRIHHDRALSDAYAGLIGSLVSTLAFYPIDVWKTGRQAADHRCEGSPTSSSSSSSSSLGHDATTSTTTTSTTATTMMTSLRDSFRGLPYKMMHVLLSSFVYNYVHSLSKSLHRACRISSSLDGRDDEDAKATYATTSVSTKLLLAAISAMINTLITLPLDAISSRRQVGDDMGNRKGGGGGGGGGVGVGVGYYDGIVPALMLCVNPALQYTVYDVLKGIVLEHHHHHRRHHHSLSSSSSSSSSSSQFNNVLQRRGHGGMGNDLRDGSTSTTSSSSSSGGKADSAFKLTMSQSFLVGLISKFVATMATYPLVRCKVMLMVNGHSSSSSSSSSSTPSRIDDGNGVDVDVDVDGDDGDDGEDSVVAGRRLRDLELENERSCGRRCDARPTPTRTPTAPPSSSLSSSSSSSSLLLRHISMPLLLLRIYRNDGGIRGLYRGCDLQLLHVLLKSALMMMVRERISD
jgi:hypothetical protein